MIWGFENWSLWHILDTSYKIEPMRPQIPRLKNEANPKLYNSFHYPQGVPEKLFLKNPKMSKLAKTEVKSFIQYLCKGGKTIENNFWSHPILPPPSPPLFSCLPPLDS